MLASYDPTMITVAAMSTYATAYMIFEAVGKGVAATGRLLTSVSYGEEDGRSMTAIMKTIFTKRLLLMFGRASRPAKCPRYRVMPGANVFSADFSAVRAFKFPVNHIF